MQTETPHSQSAGPPTPDTTRIYPPNWLDPFDFRTCFIDPGRPLEVDVGCGKGRFLLARAKTYPDRNFLGIDRMLRRIRKVDRKAQYRDLANVRLLRLDAFYAVTYLVQAATVSGYYIFFPDPWPKARHHKNRLMGSDFVDALHRTLVPGGVFHFATDHAPYFEAVRELLQADARWTPVDPLVPGEGEQTDFERYYVQHTSIGRASFRK